MGPEFVRQNLREADFAGPVQDDRNGGMVTMMPVSPDTLTMLPPFCSIMTGMMRWQIRNCAKKLIAMPYWSSSSVTSRNGL
jgi:hypothetical protein